MEISKHKGSARKGSARNVIANLTRMVARVTHESARPLSISITHHTTKDTNYASIIFLGKQMFASRIDSGFSDLLDHNLLDTGRPVALQHDLELDRGGVHGLKGDAVEGIQLNTVGRIAIHGFELAVVIHIEDLP